MLLMTFFKTLKTLYWLPLLALAACIQLAAPAAYATDGVAASRLVSTEWLAQNLKRAELLILDASPAQAHAVAHIPGAVSADYFAYGAQPSTPAQMERRLQAWGISAGKKVVLYDMGGTFMATRLFFDLYVHGVPLADLHLLDGGLAKWRAGGGAMTKEPTPAPPQGDFRVTRVIDDARAALPEFLTASGDPRRNALVEALEPSWYYGETGFFERAGHVPNATMLPSVDFFNADKTFKPAGEIRRMLTHLGITPEQQVYTYCGGGVAASVPYFAMKFMLGYPQVKLYPGSQLEWQQDPRGLPFWTYADPALMRETPWLKSWGGKMMRMYGIGQVSIIDVRPPAAYQQGHLPFALNVPADVFRTHWREPAKLAALLGQAGVNVAHEAVVVGEAGLDESAAFAWLVLQGLGQKKTSIFMDSLERWAELGQEVSREPTAVGERRTPAEPAVPRTTYVVAKARADTVVDAAGAVMARDLAALERLPAGVYPKVFVATGRKPPVKAPPGAFIHLPFNTLLQADGKPKAAKDLWNQISKAGVPRYAEIVLFADDPGEAAAAQFIFKLMGFPDVKAVAL